GTLSDRWGRKWMIAGGMWVQAVALGLFVIGSDLAAWLSAAVLLGLGTALVYPTLLAAVSDVAHPTWRASAVGVYRLWRDGRNPLRDSLAVTRRDVLLEDFQEIGDEGPSFEGQLQPAVHVDRGFRLLERPGE